MLRITKCPSCGSREIIRVTRNWTGRSQSRRFSVPNLEFYECLRCGEKVYEREAMRRIQAHSPAYSKSRPVKRSA